MMLRRQALQALGLCTAQLAAWLASPATARTPPARPSVLDLQRGVDRFRIDLQSDQGYQVAAWLLRDLRMQRVGRPDPRMLHLLAWGQAAMALHGHTTVLVVTSGLRTEGTHRITEGAARASLHLPDSQGMFRAVDLDPVGVHRNAWGMLMARLGYGGVGFYRTHVHVDSGPAGRIWANG
ncbi:MAG: D-Ala-D-Ala carboxypeptidase family metallohydrolase [Pseudomonadota bacterium]|jgi:uncharacterized protein YcbK (DUF882 family)